MVVRDLENHLIGLKTQCLWVTLTPIPGLHGQGLLTLSEEIAFTAQPKINWHTHIFKFCQSIFCLPHSPKFSDLFDLCLHWVSVTMANKFKIKTVSQPIIYFYKKLCLRLHEGFGLKCQPYPRKKTYLVVQKIVWCAYVGGSWMSFSGKKTFYHQQIRVKRRNRGSIYSKSIGHILEQEFFCLDLLGSQGNRGKK